MTQTRTRRSALRPPGRLIAAVLALGAVAGVGAWWWGQFGPEAQREREIARALGSVMPSCHVDREGNLSAAAPGERLGLGCGGFSYEAPGGPFVGATKYDSAADAQAAFRRLAADPTSTVCRTSTEVFLVDFTQWPSGASRRAAGVRAGSRAFCAAVGAGEPHYATDPL